MSSNKSSAQCHALGSLGEASHDSDLEPNAAGSCKCCSLNGQACLAFDVLENRQTIQLPSSSVLEVRRMDLIVLNDLSG